jgi:hypothetical protein
MMYIACHDMLLHGVVYYVVAGSIRCSVQQCGLPLNP